ncbi:zinc finger CCCH domain-containing protein 18-like [Cynara cardunculus var. scolymus]|uniref:zinc finger CCCH domain-containing protein 18-like n=1 Tax=Cynara cardunculus var. scolymus TaxID=59895 RepID=UPI000D62942A|nr:zinc finger CCCH domain-containing protein 18-like [Cynara cardunculus var. scolymus]XP_024976078.1 zinc finger CCCH domain-containing protein 18-like [Cynara cardunculus var. scolymus]
MEAFEAAKVVYNRILETESETITRKIIGYIYLLDHADREMIRLAFGPDNLIQNLIQKAKIELNLVMKPIHSPPISPSLQFRPVLHSNRPFLSSQIPSPMPLPYPNMVSDDCRYQNQDFFIGLGAQFEPFSREISGFSEDCYSPDGNFGLRGRRDGIPSKICHYFSKGHCKHGNNCKFFHAQSVTDFNSNELDDQGAFSPGSLEKLEFEITEILKSRRGNPISIASLPMIYYERYGRTLQAEGYLTESQRHGKAGYSLTKLLARLKNSIRLIDRPHGQHSVVLADDASRFMENRYERANMNPGPIVSGSKQIYLTFPAESTFTEDDVANYFSTFGPVQDVRIPCQQKRMFGFVTFHNAETVQTILSKGNPHYVCGARVLVKPYREKLKLFDRKYFEKLEAPMCYHSHHMDMDHDLQARLEASRLFGRQLEDHELAMQLEMMRLSQLQLARGSSYLENTLDDQKPSEDEADDSKFQSPKLVSHQIDHVGTNYNVQDNENSRGLNLPDSPFCMQQGGI